MRAKSIASWGLFEDIIPHPVPRAAHTVRQMMSLLVAEGLEPVYDMQLYAAEADRAWWTARRGEVSLGGGPYAVLAPTSRWPSKRWPPDRWSQLIGPLRDRGLREVVLVGAPSEREQVRQIIERDV